MGNADGLPALYLHGGPGSGASVGSRRIFDPAAYRAVLFDQRGCGRSRPLADHSGVDLTINTTADLLRDIEHLRGNLGIDRWVVVGTSWGVPLASAYAQAHPERVTAMVLAAVTAGTRRETDWITRDMLGRDDVSSPLDTAWDLHQAWPSSRQVVLDDAGQGGSDMIGAMVQALDEFRRLH